MTEQGEHRAKGFEPSQIELLASVIAGIRNDGNRRFVSKLFGDRLAEHQKRRKAHFNARAWNRQCGNGLVED